MDHSMCGSGARWCARADAMFDVPDLHVLIDRGDRRLLADASSVLGEPHDSRTIAAGLLPTPGIGTPDLLVAKAMNESVPGRCRRRRTSAAPRVGYA